jgi:hypothetical protein
VSKLFKATLDDNEVPYVWAVFPPDPDLDGAVDGCLLIDLAEGATIRDAKALAAFLNEKVTKMYFMRDPDPTRRPMMMIDCPN